MNEVLTLQSEPAADQCSSTPHGEPVGIPPSAVREELSRILVSRAFARSPRISRFLSFAVEQTLAGQETQLKEYMLGVEVFNRTESFDPRIDSIVRVEARRLRYKLQRYYETEGRDDRVCIRFHKGCYVPSFTNCADDVLNSEDVFAFPYLNPITNAHAFALYAKGRFHMSQWNADGIAEAISFLSQATLEEPGFTAAHAALSSAWTFSALLGVMPGKDAVARARKSAGDALEQWSSSAEGHSVEALTGAFNDFEWGDAENRLRRAIPMNPCDAQTRIWYGLFTMLAGRFEDARTELSKAQQASPESMTATLALGFAAHLAKSYDEALLQYRLAQEMNPESYAPYLAMGLLFTERQMFDQAQFALVQANEFSPQNPPVMAALVYGYACAGRTDAARRIFEEMSELESRRYISPIYKCLAYASLNEIDHAVRALEQAYEDRSPWLALVRLLPAFASVRNDPRYPALLARIGLT